MSQIDVEIQTEARPRGLFAVRPLLWLVEMATRELQRHAVDSLDPTGGAAVPTGLLASLVERPTLVRSLVSRRPQIGDVGHVARSTWPWLDEFVARRDERLRIRLAEPCRRPGPRRGPGRTLWVLRCALANVFLVTACGWVDIESVADPDGQITECPINTTAICRNAKLTTCDTQGNVIATTPCALDCNVDESRCNKLDPSNGLAAVLDEAALDPDLMLIGAATIDTDAGTIVDTSGPRFPPTATLSAFPIGVFIVKANTLVAGDVTVVGSRAFAIVAAGTITLNGVVSVAANFDVSGPGAIVDNAECRGGSAATGSNGSPGGGGGGFGTVGGAGGNGGGEPGGLSGRIVGSIELVPLRGGCSGGHPGGRGEDADPVASDPGGGGGAIQVVSGTSIVIAAGGFVSANGAGGKGNTGGITLFCFGNMPCGDGEGGGSGGGILLEAPVVTVAATGGIVANGGAGSCLLNAAAEGGQLSDVPASGQTCGGDTGNGGSGAAGSFAAGNGGNGLNDAPVGGGGGGGHGRIRVNVALGQEFLPIGTVSPAGSVGVLRTR